MEISMTPVSPLVFKAMQVMDVEVLSQCSERDLRPALPNLVRMSLCAPIDHSDEWRKVKKNVLKILSEVDAVNSILALLSIDFHALEEDTRKEQQLRCKIGGKQSDSILISQIDQSLTREFEQSDADRKLRLILSEILFTISKVKEFASEFSFKACELFEDPVYVEEVSDVLCIARAELPSLLPMSDLSEALLRMKHGAWMICKLLASNPESFLEVCQHLINGAEKEDETCLVRQRRIEVLESLCRLNPLEDLHIRQLCISEKVMPTLVLSITLQRCRRRGDADGNRGDDLVLFLTGLLLGNYHSVRTWFSQFIKSSSKSKEYSAVVEGMRAELLRELRDIVPEDAQPLQVENAVRASGIIRLYCALKGMAALKFSDNETYWLLHLVTSRTITSPATSRFIQLSICMLLACPNLLMSHAQEKMMVGWIRRLMDTAAPGSVDSESHSYRDMLFLIAIHFHGSQREAIAELVSNTLGMRSAVKANALNKIRDIFTKEIFTEQVITTHAASLPVIPNLSANIPGYLSIHSIYQLLKNRTFTKYKVPIKEWIYRQLCSIRAPLHPILPSLIEAFIQSIILPGARAEFTNRPITEQEVLAVFGDTVLKAGQGGEERMDVGGAEGHAGQGGGLSQLLMVYYVLLYEDVRTSNMRAIVTYNRQVHKYSVGLINQLPISHVVLATQRDGSLTTDLFASLLRLLTTHYPHLCLVQDWLDNALLVSAPTFDDFTLARSSHVSISDFKNAIDALNASPCPSYAPLHTQLQALASKPATDLIDYADILLSSLPCVLRDDVPRKVVDLVKKIWFRLHCVVPRHLRLETVKTLQIKPHGPSLPLPITEKDVTVDPLLVLRCDPRVFRCPPLLEITLRILASYLQECRVYLASHIHENPIIEKTAGSTSELEREELKNALITAQESAAVQILLESCVCHAVDKHEGMLSNLQEVRCLVCSHLHQMFIADPNLTKLVHFQGYDRELLAMTVSGVPSMHICLDFIPELISQPQMDKQVFAVELVSHLCGQYALPKTMGVAKLAMDVMFTVLGGLYKRRHYVYVVMTVFHNTDRATFFCKTLPCLVSICRAFPPLCDDATTLLTQVGRVTLSHLSATGVKHPQILQDSCSHSITDRDHKTLRASLNLNIKSEPYYKLYETVQDTFKNISEEALVNKNLY